jgi:hypothetical protein
MWISGYDLAVLGKRNLPQRYMRCVPPLDVPFNDCCLSFSRSSGSLDRLGDSDDTPNADGTGSRLGLSKFTLLYRSCGLDTAKYRLYRYLESKKRGSTLTSHVGYYP